MIKRYQLAADGNYAVYAYMGEKADGAWRELCLRIKD